MKTKLLVVALVQLAGCSGLTATSAARDQFVGDVTCPENRVVVVHASATTPPPDVAADPDRLALWNKEAQKAPIYAARGCGQEVLYRCNPYGDIPYHYNCMPVARP